MLAVFTSGSVFCSATTKVNNLVFVQRLKSGIPRGTLTNREAGAEVAVDLLKLLFAAVIHNGMQWLKQTPSYQHT